MRNYESRLSPTAKAAALVRFVNGGLPPSHFVVNLSQFGAAILVAVTGFRFSAHFSGALSVVAGFVAFVYGLRAAAMLLAWLHPRLTASLLGAMFAPGLAAALRLKPRRADADSHLRELRQIAFVPRGPRSWAALHRQRNVTERTKPYLDAAFFLAAFGAILLCTLFALEVLLAAGNTALQIAVSVPTATLALLAVFILIENAAVAVADTSPRLFAELKQFAQWNEVRPEELRSAYDHIEFFREQNLFFNSNVDRFLATYVIDEREPAVPSP